MSFDDNDAIDPVLIWSLYTIHKFTNSQIHNSQITEVTYSGWYLKCVCNAAFTFLL